MAKTSFIFFKSSDYSVTSAATKVLLFIKKIMTYYLESKHMEIN